MSRSVQFALAGILAACAVVGWVLLGADGEAGPRSSGEPTEADYCNVLLVPTVAERIGLDLPTRLRAATEGTRLLHAFRGGPGHRPELSGAGEAADRAGTSLLERAGASARALLPALARSAFARLFASGELVRVRFRTHAPSGRYLVTFGWYAEERARTEPRSLRALEDALRDCHAWIASADEANRLLGDESEDVQAAADRWWDAEEGASRAGRPAEWDKKERESRRRRTVFRSRSAAVRGRIDAARDRMDESRRQRAEEREAFRAKVRAQQEAVRARIESARQGER